LWGGVVSIKIQKAANKGDLLIYETAFSLPVGKIHNGRLYLHALEHKDGVVIVELCDSDLQDIRGAMITGQVL
jgi:hypothetical protein